MLLYWARMEFIYVSEETFDFGPRELLLWQRTARIASAVLCCEHRSNRVEFNMTTPPVMHAYFQKHFVFQVHLCFFLRQQWIWIMYVRKETGNWVLEVVLHYEWGNKFGRTTEWFFSEICNWAVEGRLSSFDSPAFISLFAFMFPLDEYKL